MAGEIPQNLEKKPEARRQNILTDESLGWAKELMGIKGSNDRTKLKEELDSQAEIKPAFFDLGDSKVDKKLSTEVNAAEPNVLVGSVDATGFETKWHETKWYKPFAESSSQIDKLKPLFDEPTLEWYNSLSPAFETFKKLDGMDPKDFSKNVKKEIWNIVRNKGGEQMIYGPNGFFNFVLAFDRIKNLYSPLDLANVDTFQLKDIPVKKIKLVAGKGKGEKEGEKDRFAYAVIAKNKPAPGPGNVAVPDEKPQVDPNPGDAGKKNDVPPAKPLEADKIPVIGTPEFFAKYEIADVDHEDFVKGIEVFDNFLNNKERGIEFLERKDWLTKANGENDSQYETRMNKLFGTGGEIENLRNTSHDAMGLYSEFYNDFSNPESYKYVKLFTLLRLRISNYADKNNPDTFDRLNTMRFCHEEIVEMLEPIKAGENRVDVLKQLVSSAKFLFDITGEDENLIKDRKEKGDSDKIYWKKRLDGYKGELDALDKR
ncbi:MAG: hypothetical protein NTZ25_03450 [Candidatus Peregrinibacteria bacterium]|nr:hypothetical protein [Candidatus Peregrinibacteria bacterium]